MPAQGFKKQANIEGVDFDGTLAKELHPYDPTKAGPPIPKMVRRVRNWIKQGVPVVIVTARMSKLAHTPEQLSRTRMLLKTWCKTFLGKELPLTAEKHPLIARYWDNHVVQVETDTGNLVIRNVAQRALSGASTSVLLSRSRLSGKDVDVRMPRSKLSKKNVRPTLSKRLRTSKR